MPHELLQAMEDVCVVEALFWWSDRVACHTDHHYICVGIVSILDERSAHAGCWIAYLLDCLPFRRVLQQPWQQGEVRQ